MSETPRELMAIVLFQEQIMSSDLPINMKRPTTVFRDQSSSCLKEITNVVDANPLKSESHRPKRCKKTTVESLYDNPEDQYSVMERAKNLEANLAPEFPRVAKVMRLSNVTGSFCLSLPKKFCSEHLPDNDTMIVLEDESGREFQTKYLVRKAGLSGGWRGFSIAHNIRPGDVVVFHRVAPSKMKVYIVKSSSSIVVDCGLGLIKVDDDIRQVDTENVACESSRSENLQPLDYNQKENSKASSDSEDSEVLNGLGLSESVVPFEKVKSVENFDVVINCLVLNSEFSKYHLTMYYELCCSQNTYLHERILESLNYKLVAGIISETINISDGIRACKITTSECDFSTWDKTLHASEILGMNVGFLRSRLNKLASLASELRRCKEATADGNQVEAEVKLEAVFQEVAKAPW